MSDHEIYEPLFDKYIAENEEVGPGVMMREPALKAKGKVFAFFYRERDLMCFKLGKDFPIKEHGIDTFSYLSPFKNKPPMYAWFLVGTEYFEKWDFLTKTALNAMLA